MVYSVGSDTAMPTVAAVSERLGLPCFHDVATTETLHRKVLLRSFLDEHGLSPVAHRVLRSVEDAEPFDAFPAIVKPSDSQGQRGIRIVHDHDEAAAALPEALAVSATRTAIIEELLEGPEISVHVFVVDGRIEFALPSDRYVWDGPLTGIPSGHAIPSRFLDPADRPTLDRLMQDVVTALGVGTGPLYFQLKLTPRGPRIIEIAPRLDGCHLWRLIEIHTGFNILDRCFDLLAGGAWTPVEPWDDAVVHQLLFDLGPPSEPVTWAQPRDDDATLIVEDRQVAEGELPRDTNGVVSRLGYRIVRRP
jgi:biotin carboxylase